MAETGWHRHGSEPPSRDESCIMCDHMGRLVPPAVPILLLPLDGLEETIAREVGRGLRENGLSDKPAEFDSDIHSWRCQYPERYGPCACFQELVDDLARHIARALAGDGAR